MKVPVDALSLEWWHGEQWAVFAEACSRLCQVDAPHMVSRAGCTDSLRLQHVHNANDAYQFLTDTHT